MTDFDTPQRVEELRRRVNEVDDQLVRILNKRARIVQELGKYKQESGVALFDPRREEEILRRVAKINEGPIYDTSMRDIFELIMHRIRDLEAERREFSN